MLVVAEGEGRRGVARAEAVAGVVAVVVSGVVVGRGRVGVVRVVGVLVVELRHGRVRLVDGVEAQVRLAL